MLLWLRGDGSSLERLAMVWYSRLRAERRGDHHGLNWGQGRFEGVWEVRRVVRRVEEMSHHLERALAVTLDGQGGREKSGSATSTHGQSRRAQYGMGGGSMMAGGRSMTTMGT